MPPSFTSPTVNVEYISKLNLENKILSSRQMLSHVMQSDLLGDSSLNCLVSNSTAGSKNDGFILMTNLLPFSHFAHSVVVLQEP